MQKYKVEIGSQTIELPIVPLNDDMAVALMMTIDRGVVFAGQAGRDLAEMFRDSHPDIVAAPATLGIPVAIELTRALGLDDYLILQKTPKIHLKDALAVELTSVTTSSTQRLLLDRARLHAVKGKRVLLVDDVISTGGSIRAASDLLVQAGAELIGIGSLLTEGEGWQEQLGDHVELVRSLGSIPVFRNLNEKWVPTSET